MARGCQCSKSILLYVSKRTVHIYRMGAFEASLERGTLHELVSSGFTSRAVQRVTEIRNDLALLSDSMANLMCSGPTTSRARVQRMPSVLGAPVPSEAAAACRGRGGGRGSRKDLAMKNEN